MCQKKENEWILKILSKRTGISYGSGFRQFLRFIRSSIPRRSPGALGPRPPPRRNFRPESDFSETLPLHFFFINQRNSLNKGWVIPGKQKGNAQGNYFALRHWFCGVKHRRVQAPTPEGRPPITSRFGRLWHVKPLSLSPRNANLVC